MKVPRFLEKDETLDELVLRTRYGTTDPILHQVPICSMNVVSKHLQIGLPQVRNVVKRHFYKKY